MKEKLMPVPGYAGYFIDPDTLEAWSYKQRRPRKLRKFKAKEYYLFDGTGRRLTLSPLRMLYCAQHAISPDDLSSDLIVIRKGNGLEAIRKDDLLRWYNASGKTNRRTIDAPDFYRESIRWAQTVLDAYRTGDYSEVIRQIWSLEPDAREYMWRNNYAIRRETADEMWSDVAEYILAGIKEQRLLVGGLKEYMYKVIRTRHAKMSKLRKIQRAFKEGIARRADAHIYL